MAEGYSRNLFTPKNILIYVVVGVLIYGAAYFLFLKKDNSLYQNPTKTSDEVVTNENSLTVALDEQNASGESGTATLTEAEGKTTVTIALEGAPSDIPQPAHIHSGACPAPGDIAYPLTDVVNGASETVLDVDMATLKSAMPLAINVHKSAEEISVYTACGDLGQSDASTSPAPTSSSMY